MTDEQFTLSFNKTIVRVDGTVYSKGKSSSGDEIKITIKTINNYKKYIGKDLMKSDCEILRVKVFGDKDVRGSRTAANFNAFMEPTDGSLNSYIKTKY